jgi:two-component system cell cycle response regulator
MQLLIAEDDIVTRKLLQKTLADWGYETLSADNGKKAYDIFLKENVKFIIADWMMPDMDGITLCRLIRSAKERGYVYFILLTGKGEKEDLINGLAAGADDYVLKPFDRDELRVKVKIGDRILNLEKDLSEKNELLENLNSKLEKLVRHDILMGIGNRLHFYETIEKVHLRGSRYATRYGIIMCDIDQFKAYNDTYGHLAGDNVLKIVADAMKGSIRKSDDIFRYGGEEIVIILPDQDLSSAVTAAQKVKESVEALGIENKKAPNGILTISCGVAAFDSDTADNHWEEMLNLADKALYKAKLEGRNKVCTYV